MYIVDTLRKIIKWVFVNWDVGIKCQTMKGERKTQ